MFAAGHIFGWWALLIPAAAAAAAAAVVVAVIRDRVKKTRNRNDSND
jgi:hypothetical protein